MFSQGEVINSPASLLPEAELLDSFGCKSLFAVPVFINSTFWGFVLFEDLTEDRFFDDECAEMLRSAAFLCANTVIRHEQAAKIRDSSVRLEAALKDAEKASHAKSDFLASMSHDMRTPLNAVIGLSGLSLENKHLDEETQSNFEKIYNAGSTLLSLVNDILDISKIEAGKLEVVPSDYEIPNIINDTITQNILRIGEKPIELKLIIDENMFTHLNGDELRIKQIMNNLLSNAIKYTREGMVELSMLCTQENTAPRDHGVVWLDIQVRDTGMGIKPEDMKKLFIDYSQIDLESHHKIEGTGLGLAITKRLAEIMDGSISVESEYGKGSVFTVRLKQKFINDERIGSEVVENLKKFRYSNSKRSQSAQLKRISLPHAKVLIVDDNTMNLDVAKGLLKPYGMHIDCVTNGQESVDIVKAEKMKYNAIFMDHMMPGMDGIEATQLIRSLDSQYAKTVPIIAVTANAIIGNEKMFLEKGFSAFLPKPVNIIELDSVITKWICNNPPVTDGDDPQSDESVNGNENNDTKSKRESKNPALEIPGVLMDAGLELYGGDMDLYQFTVGSFVALTPATIEGMRIVTEESLADYAILVHSLKSACAAIGAEELREKARQLEIKSKAGDLTGVLAENHELLKDAESLINDAKVWLETLGN
jgi:signal transduction histidine kinase/DNA-binding response OmpR family regulator